MALFPVSGGKYSPDRTFVEIGAGLPADLRLIVRARRTVTAFTRDRYLPEIPVGESTFAGAFLWVDMEGPRCVTSTTQAQTIRALTASRADVTFLTLVTADRDPLSTPDQGSARRWASAHGLPPARVVAYDSTMTVPRHILYSPTGQTLLRHTGYLPPEQLQAILTGQLRRWQAPASAE